jgi:transposase
MRGDDQQQGAMFSYVSLEHRVPENHSLQPLRVMVDQALVELSPAFEGLYSRVGRPSIPPEKLLRALLLQVLYTIRSERMLVEQLDYNLLFRWFVGLGMDDAISRERSARMPLIARRPTLKPSCSRRARGGKPNYPTWAMS